MSLFNVKIIMHQFLCILSLKHIMIGNNKKIAPWDKIV